jgi:hypothetical protein
MKFIKYLFTILGAVSICVAANAQQAGVITLLNGGTTTVQAGLTNNFIVSGTTNQFGSVWQAGITSSNLMQSVAEYNTVGLTWQFKGLADTTNAVIALKVYKSFDNGVSFEDNPSFTYSCTPAAPGSVSWTTNQSITVTDTTTLGFTVENHCADYITNVVLKVNLKPTKVYSLPARN